jgi:D-glycero-beta-D-manno-heptose-7-phosphate kinase
MPADPARLRQIASAFPKLRILALGDLMLDEFIWGKVSRISPEAPVPVVNVTGESYYPGGAANVARNLREFTPHTAVMGLAGRDEQGGRLLDLLDGCGIDTSLVVRAGGYPTTVKMRIIARNQQVVRVDRERKTGLEGEAAIEMLASLSAALERFDAVVVADYGKGFVTQAVADCLCRSAAQRGTIVAVDPHPHTSLAWKGVTAIKPNRLEAFDAAAVAQGDPVVPPTVDAALLETGQRLLDRWQPGSLLITLGEHGMMLFEAGAQPFHIPTRAQSVFDVSGAGDTAISVFTLGLAAGATPQEAADLANRASGIVVGKLGTATVTPQELDLDFGR